MTYKFKLNLKQQRRGTGQVHAEPGRSASSEEVGRLCVLVAVQDVQALATHEGCHLAHSCLACSCLPHKEHRLCILEAPARNIIHVMTGHAACFLFCQDTSSMRRWYGIAADMASGQTRLDVHKQQSSLPKLDSGQA
jgi:hypothetical protein